MAHRSLFAAAAATSATQLAISTKLIRCKLVERYTTLQEVSLDKTYRGRPEVGACIIPFLAKTYPCKNSHYD
ncbi:hypothetical protein HOY82DRAFT_620006 [Tuber indicum]|nr:hypothetical protein HOY82DRAFT_620006 [Tuber indicum]